MILSWLKINSFAFRCAIASYLVEVIHCECFAGLKDSSHPPAGKRCPGDVVSATACTPVWYCVEFALKKEKHLHHYKSCIFTEILHLYGDKAIAKFINLMMPVALLKHPDTSWLWAFKETVNHPKRQHEKLQKHSIFQFNGSNTNLRQPFPIIYASISKINAKLN